MKPHRPFELQEYDPNWKNIYSEIEKEVQGILDTEIISIEHIGSTSIEGMVAKPQIDVLVVVSDLDSIKRHYSSFEEAGYIPLGRGYVSDDDEYMSKDAPDGHRVVSIHILQKENPKIGRYRAFRDYLRQNTEDRERYIAIKKQLFETHPDNYPLYDKQKGNLIEEIKQRAFAWAKVQ